MNGRALAMLCDSHHIIWSSMAEYHLRFSRALVARGIQPVLVFSSPLSDELASRFRSAGAQVETLNYSKGVLGFYRGLGKIVKKHSITVVHINFFNYFDLVPWLSRLNGVRNIIYVEHNSGVLRARGWKKKLIRLRARAVTAPVTKAAAVSQFIRQQLIDVGFPEGKVSVVYNGVDMQRFSPDRSQRELWADRFAIGPDEVVICSLSQLRPVKHPELIVKALGLLLERGVKARLFMAGAGEMRQELEEMSRSLGISGRTHWLGNIDNPESLLCASDIFVLATVGEAFGLAVAEAMACGVPVVGSRIGAIPEVVEDGRTGLLATPLDAFSFADALERLARDESLRREMGTRAVERVQRYFTLEESINNMLKLCESVWGPELPNDPNKEKS